MRFQNLATVLACSLLSANPVLSDHDHNYSNLTWSVLGTSLPKPISDHTASLSENGLIYIAGGCDDPDGNVLNEADNMFFCTSISNSFYSFDVATNTFTTLTDMPRARYRHAGVAVNDQIWLVGGRDVEDALLGEVDVYDIATGEWTTFTDLPESHWLSDLSGFASKSHLYIVGGFDAVYNATDTVYSINPVTSMAASSLEIGEVASLSARRGDVYATVDASKEHAYVGGGFSHENTFCAPLGNVDKFDFASETWEALDPLPTPRADKVLAVLNDHLFAIGGERQIEGHCDLTDETPDMGELTIPVDDVEVWDGDHWNTVMSLPEHRFRFAAATIGDKVYTFGGQEAFDDSCKCMRTSTEIVTYSAPDDAAGSESGDESPANIIQPMFNLLAVLSSLCLAIYF